MTQEKSNQSLKRKLYLFYGLLILSAFAVSFLTSCSAPCMYQGKAVSKQDAVFMKNLGMSVVCPEDEAK